MSKSNVDTLYTERITMPSLEMKRQALSRGLSDRINGLLLLSQSLKDSRADTTGSSVMRGILRKNISSALESLGEEGQIQYVKMALDTDAVLSLEDLSFDLKRNREEVLKDLRQLAKEVGPIANLQYQLSEVNRHIKQVRDLKLDTLLTDLQALEKGNIGKKVSISYPDYLLEIKPGEKVSSIILAIDTWLNSLKELSTGAYAKVAGQFAYGVGYPYRTLIRIKENADSKVKEHRTREYIMQAVGIYTDEARSVFNPSTLPGCDTYSTNNSLAITRTHTPIHALPMAKSYVGFGIRTRQTPGNMELCIPSLGMGTKETYSENIIKEEVSVEDIIRVLESAQLYINNIQSILNIEQVEAGYVQCINRYRSDSMDLYHIERVLESYPNHTLLTILHVLGAVGGSDADNDSAMYEVINALDISVYSEEVQDALLAVIWYTLYIVEEIQTYMKLVIGLKEMRSIAKIATSVKDAL